MHFDSAQALEPFAQEAVDYAAGLQVGLEWDSLCTDPFGARPQGVDGQACYDRYCRMLGYIRLIDGGDLGEELLEEGRRGSICSIMSSSIGSVTI